MSYFIGYFLLGCFYSYYKLCQPNWIEMQFHAQRAVDNLIKETKNEVIKSESDKLKMLSTVMDFIVVIIIFVWPVYLIRDLFRGFK